VKRLLVLALVLAACRTSRPAGETPLSPVSNAHDLVQRRDEFQGERSIVRIRRMNGRETQSARAQLQVDRAGDMMITAYAPVINAPALRLYAANGRIVFLNDLNHTAWEGSAGDFTGTLGFVGSNPRALAFLILGLPAKDAKVVFGQYGLQSARLQDVVVAFDPPVYPPQKVVIVHGKDRVEIDHLEDYVSPAPIPPLTVPPDYKITSSLSP